MIIRSTGLGRTELEGYVESIQAEEDYLIIGMRTTEPVKWHVRVATNFPDLFKITLLLITTRKGWGFMIRQTFKSIMRPFKRDKSLKRPKDF